MKSKFFLFVAALVITATASAQSTVDSITPKYKIVPMLVALTIEKTYPVLATYQLGGNEASMTAGTNRSFANSNGSANSSVTSTSTTNANSAVNSTTSTNSTTAANPT